MGGSRNRSEPTVFVEREYPLGGIFSWSGSIASIPGTFRLCDGTLGTPDLRDKFIVGADSTYPVNGVGGLVNHDHGFTGGGHVHDLLVGTDIAGGLEVNSETSSNSIVGTTGNQNTALPPYYALAFIMYAGRTH